MSSKMSLKIIKQDINNLFRTDDGLDERIESVDAILKHIAENSGLLAEQLIQMMAEATHILT